MKGHVINESRCLAHSDNMLQIYNIIDRMNSTMGNFSDRLTIINNCCVSHPIIISHIIISFIKGNIIPI